MGVEIALHNSTAVAIKQIENYDPLDAFVKTRLPAFVILVAFLDMTEITTKSFTGTASFYLIDNLNNAKFSFTQLLQK